MHAVSDFFANTGLDEKNGEVIVKLVNAQTKARDIHLNLSSFGPIRRIARVITLSGDRPTDENSLDVPLKISPHESSFDQAASEFAYTVKPLSVTILRLKPE